MTGPLVLLGALIIVSLYGLSVAAADYRRFRQRPRAEGHIGEVISKWSHNRVKIIGVANSPVDGKPLAFIAISDAGIRHRISLHPGEHGWRKSA